MYQGRLGRWQAFRELIIPFGSGHYLLRYREELGRVLIVRVRPSKEEGF